MSLNLWVYLIVLSSSVVYLCFDTSYFSFFVYFYFSNVLSVYLNLRAYLFLLVFVVEVLFRLAVFGGNLLTSDLHSSVTIHSHVQACQWTDSISLLTWGLLWASAYSLEAWRRNGISLLYFLTLYITTSITHCSVQFFPENWNRLTL